MSQTTVVDRTRFDNGKEPYHEQTATPTDITLLDLLHNLIVLDNVVPYLKPVSLLNLAATSRDFHGLIRNTPGVFRYLDLSGLKNATLEAVFLELDPNAHGRLSGRPPLNPLVDQLEARPMRLISAVLRRQNILTNVQTLILDGLTISGDYIGDILEDPTLNVRILSMRGGRDLNHEHLRRVLKHACRSDRPEGMPKIKAVYFFGYIRERALENDRFFELGSAQNFEIEKAKVAAGIRRADPWWCRKGAMISKYWGYDWAACLLACEGKIAFDAVVCRGPRHRNSPVFGAFGTVPVDEHSPHLTGLPSVASFSLSGCESCGTSPEGLFYPTDDLMRANVPLLGPPPLLSSSLRAAKTPGQPATPFVPRCRDCLTERYCAGCHKWWCEACYTPPGQQSAAANIVVVDDDATADDLQLVTASPPKPKARVSKSCWECGTNCDACIDRTQRFCRRCCGGYCIIHNEGSSEIFCDWCVSRGRGLNRL